MRGARFIIAGIFTVGLSTFLLVSTPAVARAQAPTQGPDPTYSSPSSGSMSREAMSDGAGRIDPVEAARRQQMQRAEIRQSLAEDTNKLVQLAQELKDEINQAQPDVLTQAELKKYAEIGKLAHKVKSEMKDFGMAPSQIEPLPGIVPAPDPRGKRQR